MHNPIGPSAFWGTPNMENEGLLHPNSAGLMVNGTVFPSGLPVPFLGSPVSPPPISVLLIQSTEEIPLQVPCLQLRLI